MNPSTPSTDAGAARENWRAWAACRGENPELFCVPRTLIDGLV